MRDGINVLSMFTDSDQRRKVTAMNPVCTMEDLGLARCDRSENAVLAFLASRSPHPARQLAAPAVEVFKGIRESVDQLLLAAIETRTKEQYQKAFSEVFPKFAGITLALAGFSRAVVPQPIVNRLARESICEMEADFREKGLAAFGADVKQQAMFTIWTLRKISELLIEIADKKPSDPKQDAEFSQQFNLYAIWAKFSLDCLLMALRLNRTIYPEVLEELLDGLRSMVNAYAWARKGLELRVPRSEPVAEPQSIDDENQDLLDAAFQNAAELEA
jgi:hypothetical protein